MAELRSVTAGKVYLVGAGPGAPGLLTVRAAECLRQADLVLYDYLVNPVILEHAAAAAELVCLGRHGTGRILSQEEINARMIDEARRRKTVVRLKGGDPSVFARTAEETGALAAAGIPFEIVPGVTAALAAAGYAGIPLTHGDRSSTVALVTGQQRRSKGPRRIDYGTLAGFPGTIAFYMGVTSAADWSSALVGRGKPPDTPVAIVRRCSWTDQQTIRCTLGTVAEVVAQRRLRPPAVIVVGEVADPASEVSWFTARSLFGTRVLITRARGEPDVLRDQLTEAGADVIVQPAVQISGPPDWDPVDAAMAGLDRYDWLVFSSPNGVRYLLDRLLRRGGDIRRLSRLKLAALGAGTADQLARYHLRADLVPKEHHCAESLVGALAGEAPGRRFLLARGKRSCRVLADGLSDAGATVDEIAVYSSTDLKYPDADVAAAVADGRIDWITVNTPAIARSMARLFGEDLRKSRLASIGPITSDVLRELGHEPAVEAAQHTVAGLVEAIASGT